MENLEANRDLITTLVIQATKDFQNRDGVSMEDILNIVISFASSLISSALATKGEITGNIRESEQYKELMLLAAMGIVQAIDNEPVFTEKMSMKEQ